MFGKWLQLIPQDILVGVNCLLWPTSSGKNRSLLKFHPFKMIFLAQNSITPCFLIIDGDILTFAWGIGTLESGRPVHAQHG